MPNIISRLDVGRIQKLLNSAIRLIFIRVEHICPFQDAVKLLPVEIPIPCRPQKTFVVFVLEVPDEVPEEDIRHALYKYTSVVEGELWPVPAPHHYHPQEANRLQEQLPNLEKNVSGDSPEKEWYASSANPITFFSFWS
ncbi:hypothetical protein J6590_028322 [Homalodisca vitripennis]|nr:hypothetical protein J6590_028322 [Homalodisca vitripennis]